jgi:type I restriction enzyme M protein
MYNDYAEKHYFRDILALPDKEAVELFNKLFDDVKNTYQDIFFENEHIQLDIKSIKYIASQIEQLSFSDTNRDILADAFQSFISPAVRGEKGQFFTPQSAAITMVDILQPHIGEYILDPACGSGTFLALVYKKLIEEFNNASNKNRLKNPASTIFGIDKEFDLARICKTYLALQGDGRSGIFCFDSLDRTTWPNEMIALAKNGFDVIITNPPFGTKIGITDQKILRDYSLAHKWAFSKSENRWKITNTLLPKQDPQVLFIELCTRLLKPSGKLGIVLPEGIVANRHSGYILDFLRSLGDIFGVIDCPRTLFQPSTDIKTVILFFKKTNDDKKYTTAPNRLFMAVVNDCGHDRRGRTKIDSNVSLSP